MRGSSSASTGHRCLSVLAGLEAALQRAHAADEGWQEGTEAEHSVLHSVALAGPLSQLLSPLQHCTPLKPSCAPTAAPELGLPCPFSPTFSLVPSTNVSFPCSNPSQLNLCLLCQERGNGGGSAWAGSEDIASLGLPVKYQCQPASSLWAALRSHRQGHHPETISRSPTPSLTVPTSPGSWDRQQSIQTPTGSLSPQGSSAQPWLVDAAVAVLLEAMGQDPQDALQEEGSTLQP